VSDALDIAAECAREPIHIPGSIQPHGVLFAVSLSELRIVQVSESAEFHLGVSAQSLVGRPLGELLDVTALALPQIVANPELERRNPVAVRVADRTFDAILHRSGERLLVELEPADPAHATASRDAYHDVHHALEHVRTAAATDELLAASVGEVRALTGFDRVMIYRFEPDDHGVVIAEARRDDLAPYLGLHYPASDIPAQARQLYVANPIRLIPDARYRPSPIVPAIDPSTGPLDLSHAVLRSVSPVHVEYLANMGVRASMSISLLHGSRLWGLIACHHETPYFVPYQMRCACALFGQVLAWQIESLADRERSRSEACAAEIRTEIVHRMSVDGIVAGLMHGAPNVLDLIPGGGAAIWRDGHCITIGATPTEPQIAQLVRWLPTVLRDGLYHTHCLASVCPFGEPLKDVASGLLALSFADAVDNMLLWFRPEVLTTVRWAGAPQQPVERDRLGPRRSFADWIEQVRLTATPWEATEISQAVKLRVGITTIVMRTMAELNSLNAELRRAVRARDDFLSMASHEFRTPLSTLKLTFDTLTTLAAISPKLTIGSERVERSLVMAERQVVRLEALVAELLDVSRLSAGRTQSARTEGVDLSAVVREVLARFADRLNTIPYDVHTSGDLLGYWDASQLDQVVTNLLSNAIKYGNHQPITIELRGDDDGVSLVVQDRGIGVSPDEQHKLFTRFHRAPSAQLHYSGFGLGLWITKQLVEAHGGTVTVESQLGHGSRFRVWIPRRSPLRAIEPAEV